jgi:BirA family biotin operon repressor/biotin-[acetyl-CoA-carboxylase] ligase
VSAHVRLSAPELERLLAGTVFAGCVVVHDTVDSTIDVVRALADAGARTGTLVLAEEQRHGRGQRGNTWFSPRGSALYFSALMRPEILPKDAAILTALAGLAACEGLRDLGVDAVLERPNDLMVVHRGRWAKIGGVLVDAAVQGDALRHAIVSAGVNVDLREEDLPPPLRGLATSIAETGVTVTREQVAGAILLRLAALVGRAQVVGERASIDRRHRALCREALPGAPGAPGGTAAVTESP